MTVMSEAAIELAAAGWRVHPCRESGPSAKAPYLEHGHLDASTDPDVIRGWWTRWPNAMIGAAVPDSLIVPDIDPRNGGSIEAIEALVGPLPPTLTSWSGRGDGGRHPYFLRPPGAFTSTRLPAGIDLKINGYLIMPPSLHPATGKAYRWELHPVAPLPPRLRELLRPPPRRSAPPTPSRSAEPLVRLVSSLRDGERNRGLFWAACRAAEGGLDLEDVLVRVAVGVGLSEREARTTVRSAALTIGRTR